MATDYEGIVSPDLTTKSSVEELTTPRFMNMINELRKTKPTTRTPQLVIQSRRFRRVLAGLRNEWDQVRPYRHAQATGLVLGQMALNPKLAATTVLTETVNFVAANGPYGVDGVLLTALSAAQWLNPTGYADALSRLGHLTTQPIQNPKGKLGIYFYDLGLGGPRAIAAALPQAAYRQQTDRYAEYLGAEHQHMAEQQQDFRRTAQPARIAPSNLMLSGYPDTLRNYLFVDRAATGATITGLEQAAADERGLGAGVRNIAYKQPRLRNWITTTDYARVLVEDGCVAMTWTINILQLALRDELLGQTAPRQINDIPDALISADTSQLQNQLNDLWITGLVYDHPTFQKGRKADRLNKEAHLDTTDNGESADPSLQAQDLNLIQRQYQQQQQFQNLSEAEIEHELDQHVQDQHIAELGMAIAPDEIRAYPVAEELIRRNERTGTVVLTSISRLAAARGRLLYPAPESLGNGLFLLVNPLKLQPTFQQNTYDANANRPLRLSDEDVDRIAARIAGTINRPQA